MALLLLIVYCASHLSVRSDAYEVRKQYQNYTFNTMTSICGNEKPERYTFNQDFLSFQQRWDNSSASVNSQVLLKVHDVNGNMIAKSQKVDLELKAEEGLPFDRQ